MAASTPRPLAHEVVGEGALLLALHGAYSTRAEVRAIVEPAIGGRAVRRLYVDLPGHGGSRPSDDVRDPRDALARVEAVLDAEAGGEPVLLLGHSYGGHVARSLAARRPERVAGLALLCPLLPETADLPAARVVRDDGAGGDLEPAERGEFEGYFVVRTAETLARFRADVLPSIGPVDDDTLDRAFAAEPVVGDSEVRAPVLVVSARQDAVVGWRGQQRLADVYARATSVVVADAGHALPHERPQLVRALVADWIDEGLTSAASLR